MELPSPLKAQTPNATPINPSDTTSIHGILNRFELVAHSLKFRGHSVPPRTISMIKASRQNQLSERQFDRLSEVRSHCTAFSRAMSGQPPEADPVKLKADLEEREEEAARLRDEVSEWEKLVEALRDANEQQLSQIHDLRNQVAKLEEDEAERSEDEAPVCMLPSSPWIRSDEDRADACSFWEANSVPRVAIEADIALSSFIREQIENDPHDIPEMKIGLTLERHDARMFAEFHTQRMIAAGRVLELLARSTLDRLEAMTAYAHDMEGRKELLRRAGFKSQKSREQSSILEASTRHLRELVIKNMHRSTNFVLPSDKAANAFAKVEAALREKLLQTEGQSQEDNTGGW